MLSLAECQVVINRHIDEINLPESPSNLYDPVKYVLGLGAKRLRPCLVLMGCNVYSDDIGPAIYPALATEVFHNFTLVHDDIMDQSNIRRSHPTVHVKWNCNIAILSGDAMLIKAYELLSHESVVNLRQILPVFNQTALQVCEGQQFDMDYESSIDVSIDDYLKMVEYKTAVLVAAALKVGALTGGANDEEAGMLYQFGRNIGIAFQLCDDLLDVFADASVFGKVPGNDIVSNKKTILLIEALNSASGTTRSALLEWIGKSDFDKKEKIAAVKEIYISLNIDELVSRRIRQYHDTAIGYLEKLPCSPERKAELFRFSDYLMNRKK